MKTPAKRNPPNCRNSPLYLQTNHGLLWGMVTSHFEQLGFRGTKFQTQVCLLSWLEGQLAGATSPEVWALHLGRLDTSSLQGQPPQDSFGACWKGPATETAVSQRYPSCPFARGVRWQERLQLFMIWSCFFYLLHEEASSAS